MTIELKKKDRKLDGREVWEIDNGFSLQHIELSREDMVEFYQLLGKALQTTKSFTREELAAMWKKIQDM